MGNVVGRLLVRFLAAVPDVEHCVAAAGARQHLDCPGGDHVRADCVPIVVVGISIDPDGAKTSGTEGSHRLITPQTGYESRPRDVSGSKRRPTPSEMIGSQIRQRMIIPEHPSAVEVCRKAGNRELENRRMFREYPLHSLDHCIHRRCACSVPTDALVIIRAVRT